MESSRAMGAMIVGAVVGAFAGYVFFTENGRAWRRQLEPALEDIARELGHFRGTVIKAASVANEGWRLLNDALGDRESQARYPTPHQTSPF